MLTWKRHIRQLKGKVVNTVRHLARSSRVLTHGSKRLLYDALVCPHLGYADVVWDGCLKQQQTELQRVHNFAARIIEEVDRTTPSESVLRQLGMVPLTEKRKIHQAVFMHKLVNGKGPAKLCDKFTHVRLTKESTDQNPGGLRSKRGLSISPKQHRTAKFENSTLHKAAKAWNQTRPELRRLDDASKFKALVQRDITLACNGGHS